MRKASVLFREQEAGVITQYDDGSFAFRYNDIWMKDASKPAISHTFPKEQQEFHSQTLFPFFYNMLPEGNNKETVCKQNRIDMDDDFGLLMATAMYDNIGAVRIVKHEEI